MNKTIQPRIAIVDPNTLAVLGLSALLQSVMPMIAVDSYGSFAELTANQPERYYHFFVDMRVVLSNMTFFQGQRHKTIVLCSSATNETTALGQFHTINVNLPEQQLLRALLMLEQSAHSHGRNLPADVNNENEETIHCDKKKGVRLSEREIQVLSLVVKGYINKEIADKLNLSLPTIISHRKNLMLKLGLHSVSALTIYAVMHGYVDVNDI